MTTPCPHTKSAYTRTHARTHLYAHTDNSRVSCIHTNVFAIATKQMTLCLTLLLLLLFCAASASASGIGIAVLFSVLFCLLNSSASLFRLGFAEYVRLLKSCDRTAISFDFCSFHTCSAHFGIVTSHTICACSSLLRECVRAFIRMYMYVWSFMICVV